MSQRTSRRIYSLRFLVVLAWSFAAFCFWLAIHLRALAWVAVLPDLVARVAIVPAWHTRIIVVGCMLVGASSLLLWRWLPVKLSASLAVLIPVLFLVAGLAYGRVETQVTEEYVNAPARRGDLPNTREQLAIQMAEYRLPNELQALIRVGTNINVRDPKGYSVLFRATRAPDLVKLVLQAGVKPDAEALVEAAFWGNSDTFKLLFEATPDDGKALVAAVGDRALFTAIHSRESGEQGREQIVQMLQARGAKISDRDRAEP
ncbi:ankyrin repeat domain-containing protein [Chamaesiphon sp.]|uniref:ankyrin repeat domain-containing protein n=1 Tax=Chamaesiphon sp. TaxID=2814140 RepID=UPI0035930A78